MARSENAREKTEELLVELRKNNTELKSSSTKAKDKIKDLEKELKNCGRLLNDAEQGLSVTNVSGAKFIFCRYNNFILFITLYQLHLITEKNERVQQYFIVDP